MLLGKPVLGFIEKSSYITCRWRCARNTYEEALLSRTTRDNRPQFILPPGYPASWRTSTPIGWRTRQFYTNEKNDCRDWMLELELWGVKVVLALGAFEVGGIFVALFWSLWRWLKRLIIFASSLGRNININVLKQ